MFSATIEIGVKLFRMSKSILKKIGNVTVEFTLMVMTCPSGGDFGTEAVQSFDEVALRERGVDRAVQSLDRRGGCLRRHHDAVPGDGFEARYAGLRDGRQIGQRHGALRGGDGERAQAAGLDVRD